MRTGMSWGIPTFIPTLCCMQIWYSALKVIKNFNIWCLDKQTEKFVPNINYLLERRKFELDQWIHGELLMPANSGNAAWELLYTANIL